MSPSGESGSPDPEWVRVKHADEVQVGMALKHSPTVTSFCRRSCEGTVLAIAYGHCGPGAEVTWPCMDLVPRGPDGRAFFDVRNAVTAGLLYRLRDLPADTGALEDERQAQFRANVRRAAGVTTEAQRVGRPTTPWCPPEKKNPRRQA